MRKPQSNPKKFELKKSTVRQLVSEQLVEIHGGLPIPVSTSNCVGH